MNNAHELIFTIINAGFSQTVMDAARAAGATGGTLFKARGTANSDAEEFYGIRVNPDKEVVMILAEKSKSTAILTNIYQAAGLNTAGQGIAFTLPVDRTVGLTPRKPEEK